mgnify:FL=1
MTLEFIAAHIAINGTNKVLRKNKKKSAILNTNFKAIYFLSSLIIDKAIKG